MKVKVLASGSKGNAIYVETFSAKVLIDCGISFKSLLEKMNYNSKSELNLDACLVTHEHVDHIGGIKGLIKNTNTMIYTSLGTKKGISRKINEDISSVTIILKHMEEIFINNLKIVPFLISHDAEEPFGFILEEDGEKMVVLTDSGYLNEAYYEVLKNADLYYFESNHDVEMLINSQRPHFLKQRILSNYGHLSNIDSAVNFMKMCGSNTKKLILAHLSEECNTIECVKKTYEEIFSEYGFHSDVEILIATQNTVLEVNSDKDKDTMCG